MSWPSEPHFSDALAAREYLESLRWPAGPVCPHCAAGQRAFRLRPRPERQLRPGVWKCTACAKQFTVTVNTLFEDSKLPLHKWLQALERLRRTAAGVTARDLEQELGITYKSAWKLLDRVRYAFNRRPDLGQPEPEPVPIGRRRPESLYPRKLDRIIVHLLHTPPERKHPLALERALAKMERRKVREVYMEDK